MPRPFRASVRAKLFLLLVGLMALVGLISLSFLEVRLRQMLVDNETAALVRQAETFRAALAEGGLDGARADRVAKRIGERQPIRVSLIDDDGDVRADSDVPAERLGSLEDHRGRPEVTAALAGAVGVSRRYSTTVKTDMLYVAVPHEHAGGRAVVRVATPLSAVDALVRELRVALLVAGLLAVVAALFMGGLASHLTSRKLLSVVDGARRLAEGASARPLELGSRDELAHIAGSVNRLAAELTRSVETLADERDRVSALLESMQEGVLALDERRRVTLANPAALALLGLDEPPLDRPFVELLRAPAALDVVERAAAAATADTELELGGPPARLVRLRATRRRGGEGLVLVLDDVTEVRRLESVRSEFVANVSHELRTPVAIIRANAEALREGALHDEQRAVRFVDALHRNAERLSQLVADLLDLARFERADFAPALTDVRLRGLCARVMAELEPRAVERQQALSLCVDDDLVVRADERALEQVLLNLLDNALKYSDAGGSIEVRARRANDAALLEVADDGPGIPPAHRERVFERFHRVDAGRSRDMGGTGLGLAIVKHLVLSMGGRVGVRANEPRGSVFFVELPRATRVDEDITPLSHG